jgi:hypothetical protein
MYSWNNYNFYKFIVSIIPSDKLNVKPQYFSYNFHILTVTYAKSLKFIFSNG